MKSMDADRDSGARNVVRKQKNRLLNQSKGTFRPVSMKFLPLHEGTCQNRLSDIDAKEMVVQVSYAY